MKRSILALELILISCIAFAQTQQGIVKTRGRMVNGQLVAGQRLTGATVTLSIGNPQVSGKNGAFSFNVPSGKNYSLVTATKQGYTLADPEYTNRSFAYSGKNPFYVVLEDEAQRQADVNAATRKVRRTLTAQLQAREDEIEALKEQNKLTEAEYQRRLQELYDNQSKSEQLVKEMSERYASTDYDQLDEFNRQVQMYIEEGELQKADSMIRSKGDIAQRVAAYHNIVAANQKERENLAQRQHALTQSESGAAKTYEELSQDLLRRSEIFLQTYQQDSAMYCLKVRADLDTTNVEAMLSYAELCYKQRAFNESEEYYLKSLRLSSCSNQSSTYVKILHNLGHLYDDIKDFKKAAEYYKNGLSIVEHLYSQDPQTYRCQLAQSQQALGSFYSDVKEYEKSEKYLKMAIKNYELSQQEEIYIVRSYLAKSYNNLGNLYALIKKHEESEICYKRSLYILEELYRANPASFLVELSQVQNNIANHYRNIGDYTNSEKYYLLSLEHKEEMFSQNPDAYRSLLASTYINLGILYQKVENFSNSEKYLLLALEHRQKLFSRFPSAYRVDISAVQNSLGGLYRRMGNYEKSECYYLMALGNRQKLYEEYPNVFAIYLVATQQLLALMYMDCGRYADAINYINKALTLKPNEPSLYHMLGESYLYQDRKEEALTMWNRVLELNPDFLKENPEGTDLYNCLKKLGLIE